METTFSLDGECLWKASLHKDSLLLCLFLTTLVSTSLLGEAKPCPHLQDIIKILENISKKSLQDTDDSPAPSTKVLRIAPGLGQMESESAVTTGVPGLAETGL